jgi:hypothetical protein
MISPAKFTPTLPEIPEAHPLQAEFEAHVQRSLPATREPVVFIEKAPAPFVAERPMHTRKHVWAVLLGMACTMAAIMAGIFISVSKEAQKHGQP